MNAKILEKELILIHNTRDFKQVLTMIENKLTTKKPGQNLKLIFMKPNYS